MIATGPDGIAVTAVRVLPYAGDAPKERLTLDVTLVPADEANALAELLAQIDPPDPADPPAGAAYGDGGGAYGGGGGGGGGGLAIAGIALGAVGMGLGIGALAKEEASPTTPR